MTISWFTKILGYHSINDISNAYIYGGNITAVHRFQEHIKFLVTHYQIVPLWAIIDNIKHGRLLRNKTIALTFDDGYADFYHLAYPILRKYEIPSTVFLSVDLELTLAIV